MADKYVVQRCLAYGGMGIVFEVLHRELGGRFVLKLVRPELANDEHVIERFANEARVAASLKSEHVARVVDFGVLPRGMPYLVMEHLEGEDLFAELRRSGPLELERAVDLMLEACEGLAEAHAIGLVHRDVKPENLFVARRPDGGTTLKLLDFGITKRADADDERTLTWPGANLGSPNYMAPEQMRDSKSVDARADIWSLGVVLYELFTGEPPFRGESMTEVCAKVLTAPAPFPSERRPDLAPALEAIVLRCLEKRPEDRFADVAELASALEPFASVSGRIAATRIRGILEGRSASVPPLVSSPSRTATRRPRIGAASAVAAMLVSLVALAWATRPVAAPMPVLGRALAVFELPELRAASIPKRTSLPERKSRPPARRHAIVTQPHETSEQDAGKNLDDLKLELEEIP